MKVLVVGFGSIAKRHIRNLLCEPETAKIQVYTRLPGDSSEFAAPEKISFVSSLESVVCDFAIIANRTREHVAVAEILAKKKIPLLIEKPVALSREGTSGLIEIVRENRVPVQIAYNLRFVGIYKHIKGILESGHLGKIYFASLEVGQYLPDWQPQKNYRESYRALKQEGGDVGLELSHEVDCMRFFFGAPQEHHVFSGKVSDLKIATDDVFKGIYRYEGGMLCHVHMDYLKPKRTRLIQIQGEHGTLFCDVFGQKCALEIAGETLENNTPEFFDFNASYVAEVRHFIKVVQGKAQPIVSLNDSLAVLDLLRNK